MCLAYLSQLCDNTICPVRLGRMQGARGAPYGRKYKNFWMGIMLNTVQTAGLSFLPSSFAVYRLAFQTGERVAVVNIFLFLIFFLR